MTIKHENHSFVSVAEIPSTLTSLDSLYNSFNDIKARLCNWR